MAELSRDPMETIMRQALEASGLPFAEDGQPGGEENHGLDFRILFQDVFIEVKRMHSPRIADQMSRAENVIAVQGPDAVRFMAQLLERTAIAMQRRGECDDD